MSEEYRRGREEGLLEAAELVRLMADDVARRLERPAPRWTRHARETRHTALRVAARRISTVAGRIGKRRRVKDMGEALAEAGL